MAVVSDSSADFTAFAGINATDIHGRLLIDGGIPGVSREFHLSGDPVSQEANPSGDFRQVRSSTRHHAGSDSGYISHDAS